MWGMRCEEVWSPQGGREGAIWERRTASSRPEGHTAEVRIRKGTENSLIPTGMIFVENYTQANFEQIWKFTFPHFKKFYSKLTLVVVVTNIKSESPGRGEGHQSGRMLPQAWDIQFTKYNRIHAVFFLIFIWDVFCCRKNIWKIGCFFTKWYNVKVVHLFLESSLLCFFSLSLQLLKCLSS